MTPDAFSPSSAKAAPAPLGIRVDGDKGTMEGRVAATFANGQRVIELPGGVQFPAPAPGDGPTLLPLGENRLLSLTPEADGTVSVRTRDIGLEANKKGDKFKGALLPDPTTGKVDIAGKHVDVSRLSPGETKTQTLKIKGKKFKVQLTMNADGTVSVEGKRKRGFLGGLFSGLGKIFSKVMPVLSVVSAFVPGLQLVGLLAKGMSLLQGGINAVKSFASGNILGGLAGLASSIAGGAKLFGANAFAAVADKVGKGLNFAATGWNALKNGVTSLFKGDILGGLAGITSGIARGASVVADWTRGAVQSAAQQVGGLFEKLSSTFGKVKAGAGFITHGLKALGSGNLLGGLASLATGLATGAEEVANWSQAKVQEVATQMGDVLSRVAKTLGLGDKALTAVRNGLQAFSHGRLAEGLSSIFNALSTGATAAGGWMRGQAARAAENLSKLFSDVSTGAARVQGLMDAVKAKNPGVILNALASALGFAAGVVENGTGQTAQLLQSIAGWLGLAGNLVNNPEKGVLQLLAKLGPQLVRHLVQSGQPQLATAGTSSGNVTYVVSDMSVGGGKLPDIRPGEEVMVSDASRPGVVATWNSGGRPVRERLSDGTENVIAYDKAGQAHRFRDEIVTTLPISDEMFAQRIPGWRRQQLEGSAQQLMDRYMRPDPGNRGRRIMDYMDLGEMLREIADWKSMTHLEKAYLWSTVATERRRQFTVVNDHVPDEVIDSHPGRAGNSVNHILVPFQDRYHARLGGVSEEQARREILDHESQVRGFNVGINLNPGDAEASMRTVQAFRAFRNGGFGSFADVWIDNFVELEK